MVTEAYIKATAAKAAANYSLEGEPLAKFTARVKAWTGPFKSKAEYTERAVRTIITNLAGSSAAGV